MSAILRQFFTLPFVPWEFILPGRNVKKERKDRTKVYPDLVGMRQTKCGAG